MKSYRARLLYSGLTLLSVILLISGWSIGFSGNTRYIERESVKLASVQQGAFSQQVGGYGELVSLNQRLITASSVAVVDDIKLRPGAVVEPDSVILILKNPELEAQHQNAKAELLNTKTVRRKMLLEQKRELLEQASILAELKAETELASLQVEAERPLAKEGIISVMDHRRSKLKANQLKARLALEQEKLARLKEVHTEALLIQDEAIKQAQTALDNAHYQVEQLTVRAGIKGVIQREPVKLGQSVNVGDELALVGSLTPLVAEIQVPQMQIQLVREGAMAEVDTRHGILKGEVVRIDPVVVEGAVRVDIRLPEELSTDIRPMQMVDATIYGKSRHKVSYVSRPAGVSESSAGSVFVLQGDVATRVPVQFGRVSGGNIEVVSGLQANDRIIISRLDLEQDISQLQLRH